MCSLLDKGQRMPKLATRYINTRGELPNVLIPLEQHVVAWDYFCYNEVETY